MSGYYLLLSRYPCYQRRRAIFRANFPANFLKSCQAWRKGAWLFLLLPTILILPGVADWIAFMCARPLSDNVVQLLTLGILLKAMFQKPTLSATTEPNLPPSLLGLVVLLAIGTLYIIGACLGIKTLLWGSTIGLIATTLWIYKGARAVQQRLPLFLFALFLLPDLPADLKNTLSVPLQQISTQITTAMAGVLIPIEAQGNIFYIRGQAYEVTVPCSGLHTWMGFLFAGLLWLVFEGHAKRAFLLLVLAAPLLALLTNSLRLFITALVAYHHSPDAGMAIHTNLEYLLFPLGIIALWGLLKTIQTQGKTGFNTLDENFPEPRTEETVKSSSPDAQPVSITKSGALLPALSSVQGRSGALLALMVILNVGIWSVSLEQTLLKQPPKSTSSQLEPSLKKLPYEIGAWSGYDLPLTHHEASVLAPARLTNRAYYPVTEHRREQEKPSRTQARDASTKERPQAAAWQVIWLQLLESETPSKLHNVYDSLIASGNRPETLKTLSIETGKGPVQASLIRARNAQGATLLMLLWYQQGSVSAESRWQWYRAWIEGRLAGRTGDWKLVTLSSPIDPQNKQAESEALERLTRFAQRLFPLLASASIK